MLEKSHARSSRTIEQRVAEVRPARVRQEDRRGRAERAPRGAGGRSGWARSAGSVPRSAKRTAPATTVRA